MEKREIIKAISQEVLWCKNNPLKKSREWEKGFIKGLEQAKRLIKKIK